MMAHEDLLILLFWFFRYVGSYFENEAFLELCQVASVPAIHTRFAQQTDTVDAMLRAKFDSTGRYNGRANDK